MGQLCWQIPATHIPPASQSRCRSPSLCQSRCRSPSLCRSAGRSQRRIFHQHKCSPHSRASAGYRTQRTFRRSIRFERIRIPLLRSMARQSHHSTPRTHRKRISRNMFHRRSIARHVLHRRRSILTSRHWSRCYRHRPHSSAGSARRMSGRSRRRTRCLRHCKCPLHSKEARLRCRTSRRFQALASSPNRSHSRWTRHNRSPRECHSYPAGQGLRSPHRDLSLRRPLRPRRRCPGSR